MQKPIAVPLIITVLLHAAVIALLAFNLSFSPEPKILPPEPKIIQATLVSMVAVPAARANQKPVEAPRDPVAEQPKPAPVEPVKPELSKPEPIKPQPPVIPPPKPDLEKQKQVEQQKAVEKEKQVQVEKEKQAQLEKQQAEQLKQEQQKKEQQKKEAEQKRKEQEQADALQKKQQEDQLRKQREQQEKSELARAMAAEDSALAAERDQEAVASYAGMIQRDIQNNWSRPPNARIGMHVVLLIQLIPSGDVINVSLLKSSGNDAFDQSAISAVRRVGKFSYLKELSVKSPQAFERQFRRLQLDFTPEDLRQ